MKKVKLIFATMLALCFCFVMAACSDDDNDVTEIFHVEGTEFALSNEAATGTFSVTASSKPLVVVRDKDDAGKKVDVSWLTLTEGSTEGNVYNYSFAVSTNKKDDSRSLLIKVTQGTNMKEISITQAGEPLVVPEGEMAHNAKELASMMYAGINLGNLLEAPSGEGSWRNDGKISEEYIKSLKNAGFNTVRIPCAWAAHFTHRSTDPAYTIDTKWLHRVKKVISWCVQNDMYVILNCHYDKDGDTEKDGGWLEDHIFDDLLEPSIIARQKAIWTQVASYMKDFDEHLLFAACNEPGMNETSGKSDMWKDKYAVERVVRYEQTMIDAVRATGGNNASRTIIVQGLGADISNTCTYMDNPDETEVATFPTDKVPDRLMVEVHFYEPYQFCLMDKDENWGNMYYYWGKDNKLAGSNRNTPDSSAEAWVDAQMAKMKAKFVDKGIPVILGEYAATFRTLGEGENQELHDKSVAYFDEYVTKVAKNNGCVPCYWETGDVIDCTNGVVKKQYIFDAIMKGASQGKYPW